MPQDPSAAYDLLRIRRASAQRQSPRFLVLGQALHERFASCADAVPGENDAWVDGDESGETLEPVMTFEVHHGRFFEAAYQHAIVQARRVGLNIYDPARGEHHLTDGQRLPSGPVIDEATAGRAWRHSDWSSAITVYRRGIAKGSSVALHDLAHVLRHGLGGLPVHTLMAGAMMQVAGATDDSRRRQRLATLKAIDPALRQARDALRDELRSAKDMLAVIDHELKLTAIERSRLEGLAENPSAMSSHDWWSLWIQAQCGDTGAAWRLADASRPDTQMLARPPWPTEATAYQRYVMLAAQQGCSRAQRCVAEGLASGLGGWPHDPAQALAWMKRALVDGETALASPAVRLRRRLAYGWKPAVDRAKAEEVLLQAGDRSGRERLRLLRRACELDHPEGWRRLGAAYLAGTDGVTKDPVVGAVLILAGHKTLAATNLELGHDRPAELAGMSAADIDEALPLAHQLFADLDPWGTVTRRRPGPPDEPDIDSEFTSFDMVVGAISPGQERAA